MPSDRQGIAPRVLPTNHVGVAHELTFSCFQRFQLLSRDRTRLWFVEALEAARRKHRFELWAYVVMPEHVHLLVSEPQRAELAVAIKSLKQGVARRLIADREHFWQKRYYDFNVHSERKFVEKLRYTHRNPVRRGLCAQPED
mgnify:CR=1 FL=1